MNAQNTKAHWAATILLSSTENLTQCRTIRTWTCPHPLESTIGTYGSLAAGYETSAMHALGGCSTKVRLAGKEGHVNFGAGAQFLVYNGVGSKAVLADRYKESEREICSLLTHGNAATFITDQDLPVRVTVVQLGALKRTVKAVESFTRIPPMHQLTGTTGANASYANPNT
ncbi:hypothetical protein PSPO01_12715 [Paraphaeosphaeria sporulosa]